MNDNQKKAIDDAYIKGLSANLKGFKGRLADAKAAKTTQASPALESDDDFSTPSPVPSAPETPDEPKDDDASKNDDKRDGFDEADQALEDTDLDSMSSEGKIELIRIIIDSAQNSAGDDDEFSDFMNKVLDVMDEFQVADGGSDDEETPANPEDGDDTISDDEDEPSPDGDEPSNDQPDDQPDDK